MQHHYTGFVDVLRSVYAQSGVRGLFHGVSAAMVRISLGSGVQLSTYDFAKSTVASLGVPEVWWGEGGGRRVVDCVMDRASGQPLAPPL